MPAEQFPILRLSHPELAACLVLLGGDPPSLQGPVAPPDPRGLAAELAKKLAVVTKKAPRLEVFYGFRPQPTPTASAFGRTVLLILPESEPVAPEEAARAVAVAWLAGQQRPAPPVAGVGEPLLALAESLAWLGSMALANAPTALLPLGQWLEPKAAAPALETLLRGVLEGDEPYRTRRSRLRELLRPGGASPELAQAAAYLLEVFGDPERARGAPMELLQDWVGGKDKPYPPAPRVLKRALAAPGEAGVPRQKEKEDYRAMVLDQALRAAWAAPAEAALPAEAAAEAQEIWQARRRALGLPTPAPALRAGEGYLLARPEKHGFAVYWRKDNKEQLLLLWPRWVGALQLSPSGEELLLVEEAGIFRVGLAGGVQQVLAGEFRGVRGSGGNLAVLAWPSLELLLHPAGRRLGSAAGGFAWLGDDLLLASDGQKLRAMSLEGEARVLLELPCTHGLAAASGQAWAVQGPPCEPTLLRLDLGAAAAQPVLRLPEVPAELLVTPQGQLVLLTSRGVLRLEGESVLRETAAFSIGPG